MIGIVVSRADSASEHVAEQLRAVADWQRHSDGRRPETEGGGTYYRREGFELRTFEDLHLHLERPATAFGADPEFLVFASRHAGETGPLLTAHFTGNFGAAEYGGDPGAFARACPNAHRRVLAALADRAPDGYAVGTECTHHGPTDVGAPSMFVELGSGQQQWDDPAGARAVARAILDLEGAAADRTDGDDAPGRQVVGFGGGHYAPRFERIARETPWAVGHVGADWALDAMGDPREHRERIDRAFRASAAEYAVLEADRPGLEAVIADLGYRAVSETWVREVGATPLALVSALEGALVPVGEGLRFGDAAADVDPDAERLAPGAAFEVVGLPGELLERAAGIDAGATREAVEAHTVAFETAEGASRVAGRAVVRDGDDREALVGAVASLLRREYDAVTREDGVVVARRTAFDPGKAAELGVPEGPAFGDLAAGRPVEVDGREIDPAAVETERVDRFEV